MRCNFSKVRLQDPFRGLKGDFPLLLDQGNTERYNRLRRNTAPACLCIKRARGGVAFMGPKRRALVATLFREGHTFGQQKLAKSSAPRLWQQQEQA